MIAALLFAPPAVAAWPSTEIAGPGTAARWVLAVDLDADGDRDAVWGSDVEIATAENLGGTWGIPTVVDPTPTAAAALSDVDGDGDDDVVVAGDALRWFETDVGLLPPVLIADDPGEYAAVASGDLDADGDLDLVATAVDGADLDVWLYRNRPTGFTVGRSIYGSTGCAPSAPALALADIVADGLPDLLVLVTDACTGGAYDHALLWLEAYGGTTYAAHVVSDGTALPDRPLGFAYASRDVVAVVGPPDGPADFVRYPYKYPDYDPPVILGEDVAIGASSLARVDLDLDGVPDLVVTAAGEDLVGWSDGAAGFAYVRAIGLGEPDPVAVTIADLDGDGSLEVLSAGDRVVAYASLDPDDDGLPTSAEPTTDPLVADTDHDGVADGVEGTLGTDPLAVDTDGDGINDARDGCPLDADPVDSDGDGVCDPADPCPGWGDGAQPFGPPVADWLGISVTDLRLVDLDGDGDDDVAWSSDYGPGIGWVERLDAGFRLGHALPAPPAAGMVAADLDGDGDGDLAAMHGSEVAWYESLGADTFVAHPVGSGDASLYDLGEGDVDGDGDVDLVAGSATPGPLQWFENTGSGAWPARQVSTDAILALAVADLDGDSDGDVVATYSAGARWYENTGAGWVAHAFSTYAAAPIGCADLDGDGDLDVVQGGGTAGGSARWFENTGGAFGAAQLIADSASDWEFALADVDDDGAIDLVLADPVVRWLRNLGGGAFGPSQDAGSVLATHVAVGDVDGDGMPDLVSETTGDDELTWRSGVGGADATVLQDGIGGDGTAAADLDGDGDHDLVSWSAGDVGQWVQLDARTFDGFTVDPAGTGAVAPADLDGDGDLDLALAGYGHLWWAENVGGGVGGGRPPGGTLGVAVEIGDIEVAYPFGAADLDGDGDTDVVTFDTLEPAAVVWFETLGGGAFAGPWDVGETGVWGNGLSVADLDGDGDPDVVTAGQDHIDPYYPLPTGGRVGWFENLGGTFDPGWNAIDTSDDDAPTAAVGDLDGDGDIDVVAAVDDHNHHWVIAYENLGGGAFDAGTTVDEIESHRIQVADLDGDGDGDLVIESGTWLIETGVWWYENLGGSWSDPAWLSADGGDVALADMDGDGDPDPINNVGWWPNQLDCTADRDGDGIADGVEGAAGTDPDAADTDGDGLDDLAESAAGSDPLRPDTDDDGAPDGTDDDPLHPAFAGVGETGDTGAPAGATGDTGGPAVPATGDTAEPDPGSTGDTGTTGETGGATADTGGGPAGTGDTGGTAPSTGTTGTTGTTGDTARDSGDPADSGEGPEPPPPDDTGKEDRGCACDAGGAEAGGALALVVLAVVGRRRRRRTVF